MQVDKLIEICFYILIDQLSSCRYSKLNYNNGISVSTDVKMTAESTFFVWLRP